MQNTEQNIVLKATNLSIGYRKKKEVSVIASGINIEINEGELVAVIGVNGAGKSTLLKTLSKVLKPIKGEVIISGYNINETNSSELAKYVSLVLTEQMLSKNLSVLELVALGRQPYTNWIGKLSKNDLRETMKAIKMVGVEDMKHKKCYELSDGQFQKVLIARALAQDTPFVILDEPTTHLDLYHKAYVLKLLKNLSQETGKAILFASHEINLALQLCDKLLILKDHKSFYGSPLQLVKSEAFKDLFPSQLIYFDEKSSSFKIKE